MFNIPNVPINIGQQLRDFLEKIRSALNYCLNQISWLKTQVSSLNKSTTALSISVGYLSDDSAVDPPFNLVITKDVWSHTLTWENIDSDRVMGVEVFYNTVNDVFTATLVATVPYGTNEYRYFPPNLYVDHYYWIRNVTWGGGYSTFVPDPTIYGGYLVPGDLSVGETISQVLAILQGQVAESQFTTLLKNRLNGIETNTSKITILNQAVSSIDAELASVEQQMLIYNTEIGDLQAEYFVKLNVNGYIAGFGVVGTQNYSEAVFAVDRFKIISPDYATGTIKQPFVVGNVDGVSTVGISGNLVVDGTIYARRIVPNNLVNLLIAKFTTNRTIYSVLSIGDTLTLSNSTTVYSFNISNQTGAQNKLVISLTGRTGITSGDATADYTAYSIIRSDGTVFFEGGWSQAQEDVKAATFGYVMGASETNVLFYIKAAKTNTNTYNVVWTASTTITLFGVRN